MSLKKCSHYGYVNIANNRDDFGGFGCCCTCVFKLLQKLQSSQDSKSHTSKCSLVNRVFRTLVPYNYI